MLVGREKEIHLLHAIQNDDSSHFVAVYGDIDLHFSMQGCQKVE